MAGEEIQGLEVEPEKAKAVDVQDQIQGQTENTEPKVRRNFPETWI